VPLNTSHRTSSVAETWKFRLAAWGMQLSERFGLRPTRLEVDDMVQSAQRQCRLENFGDLEWRRPLELLVADLKGSGTQTPVGRFVARRMLMQALTNRLLVTEALRRRPEAAATRLDRPTFVMGLPRTGTTFLHRLLAADPATRAPRFWELRRPAPPASGPDRRPREAMVQLRRLRAAAPGLARIHPTEYEAPEECTLLLLNSLHCKSFVALGPIPEYRRWLEAQDLRPTYAFHRAQLALIFADGPARRPVLKAPTHLYGLEALTTVYPDACCVFMHRDPRESVASYASLLSTYRKLQHDVDHPHALGDEALSMLGEMVHRAMEFRAGADGARCCDVSYQELMRDPWAVVLRVYEHFGWTVSPEAETAIRSAISGDRHRQGAGHKYQGTQFGLTNEKIRNTFADYMDRFLGETVIEPTRSAPPIRTVEGSVG
jgi:hypothetical protein